MLIGLPSQQAFSKLLQASIPNHWYGMIFYFHANETLYHKKGFVLSFLSKVKVFGSRKRRIYGPHTFLKPWCILWEVALFSCFSCCVGVVIAVKLNFIFRIMSMVFTWTKAVLPSSSKLQVTPIQFIANSVHTVMDAGTGCMWFVDSGMLVWLSGQQVHQTVEQLITAQ